MQWLQKANITVIYSQNIMFNDNTICLYPFFAHRSQSTPTPVTFQTDFLYILYN